MISHGTQSQNANRKGNTMKGNAEVIKTLNGLLADEYTAVHQYETHEGMAANIGYKRLSEYIGKRKEGELEHIKELTARILFLEGKPIADKLNEVNVHEGVLDALEADSLSEQSAIDAYRKAIGVACEAQDFGTRALLEHILTEEEEHLHGAEQLLTQASQIGEDNWLSLQV